MSYFDHVRCPHCEAMLDPESIGGVQGRGMRCPRCNKPLQITDLFGIADAFSEEEGANLSLDDAVPGFGGDRPAEEPAPPPARKRRGAKQIESSAADVLKQMRKKR
jgi:hypothetical protein